MEEKIHTDEYGEKSIIVYDDTGKELYQKYPSGGDEEWFDYDSTGKLIRSINSSGIEKIYEYDFFGNLIGIKKQKKNN